MLPAPIAQLCPATAVSEVRNFPTKRRSTLVQERSGEAAHAPRLARLLQAGRGVAGTVACIARAGTHSIFVLPSRKHCIAKAKLQYDAKCARRCATRPPVGAGARNSGARADTDGRAADERRGEARIAAAHQHAADLAARHELVTARAKSRQRLAPRGTPPWHRLPRRHELAAPHVLASLAAQHT